MARRYCLEQRSEDDVTLAPESENGRKIWRGKYRAGIEAHRLEHNMDPEGTMVSWASALYSGRMIDRYAEELLVYLEETVLPAFTDRGVEEFDADPRKAADKADVLSTVLAWAAWHTNPSRDVYDDFVNETFRIAREGKRFAEMHHRIGDHTYPLLLLTNVEISHRWGGGQRTFLLDEVINLVEAIEDPYQKARVYRKLGMLCRRFGYLPVSGIGFGLKAIFMPGLPLAVRAKSVAGLLGIEA